MLLVAALTCGAIAPKARHEEREAEASLQVRHPGSFVDRPVLSACGLDVVGGERTRPVKARAGRNRRPTLGLPGRISGKIPALARHF